MRYKGILCVSFLITSLYLSSVSIPPNQLTVHRASAKLMRLLQDDIHSFSLTYLKTAKAKSADSQPYLFVHGHKGNVKQAISMTVYFESKGLDANMYSIDFNEGAVALSYSLLMSEVNFTVACLREIGKRHPGKEIIVLAHSFGGIVAALALQQVPKTLVKGILALGTPFESPPVNNDVRLIWAYDEMYKVLNETDIFVVSITGGIRDLTVPARLTDLRSVTQNYLHVYSTSIEGLHKEIDHVAMVWGEEFFERLAHLLKLSSSLPRHKVAEQARSLFSSTFSEMIKSVNPSHPIEVLMIEKQPKTSKQNFSNGLHLGSSTFYMFNSQKSLKYEPSSVSQKIPSPVGNFSFFELLLGLKLPVKVGENLAAVIFPGRDFQEPRYPIHVKVIGEGQVQAVLGKCGHEEIVKYNENDFILFFHQRCEDGPQIWMLGFDPEYEYQIELSIDLVGMIVSMLRDLRLHVFSAMFYFQMIEMLAEYEKKFANHDFFMLKLGLPKEVCISFLVSAVFMIQFGQSFRNLAMKYLVRFVFDEKISFRILDLMFLASVGFALKTLFGLLLRALLKINEKLKGFDRFCLALVPVFYFLPWPTLGLAFLISDVPKNTFKIAFFAILAVLPQNIGWHIAFFTHGIHEFDFYALPIFVFVLSGRFCEVEYRGEVAIVCFVLGIFVHDHLFKVSVLFEGFCVLASIRHAVKFMIKIWRSKES